MGTTTDKGRFGEEIACRYLEDLACSILERNWRFGHKEIDIIAQEGRELVIVEVKLRQASEFSRAVEAVDIKKQQHLIRATNAYIQYKQLDLSVRYDIIGIELQPDNSYTIEHVKNAFYPRMRNYSNRGRRSK